MIDFFRVIGRTKDGVGLALNIEAESLDSAKANAVACLASHGNVPEAEIIVDSVKWAGASR